jgi:hypothetical protein
MKPLDEVVQRDDHFGGNFVAAIERTPRHPDTCGLEFLAETFRDLERENRVRAAVSRIPDPGSRIPVPGTNTSDTASDTR